MKLLVVSHPCATAVNRSLFEEIARSAGWELTIVIPRDWRDEFGNVLNEPETRGFRLLDFPVLGSGNIILHVYRAAWSSFLAREKFDAIYMHHEPYALATAQVCLANCLQARKAAFGFYSAQNILKSYPPPFSWVERFVAARSDFAFPISTDVAATLKRKAPGVPATVVPLPVDLDLYKPRDRREVVTPRVELGYVGRLVEAKGLRTLAVALGSLRDLNWRLTVIGTGDFRGEFEALLRTGGVHDRVRFLGYVPHAETPARLAEIDVLVVPSETQPGWKEQFGRVIVEALACGAAVVGSDSGEIPHLLRASGGGEIFGERDPNALAETLRRMLTQPALRRTAAESGAAWVRANLSQRAIAERMAHEIASARDRRQKR